MYFREIIKRFFIGLVGKFNSILKVVFSKVVKILMAKVWDIAQDVCDELKTEDLTNKEKREEAFIRVKEIARQNGIELKESITNLLIELVVQYGKNIK